MSQMASSSRCVASRILMRPLHSVTSRSSRRVIHIPFLLQNLTSTSALSSGVRPNLLTYRSPLSNRAETAGQRNSGVAPPCLENSGVQFQWVRYDVTENSLFGDG